MFTGIVSQMGSVREVTETEQGHRLVLSGTDLGEIEVGASIAVNGVCLTAVETAGSEVAVDVVPETLKRTNLGNLYIGDRVNLERPMPADGRFDGHIVQGHADGVGVVTDLDRRDGETLMTVEAPESLMAFVVEKGSITVDGVSLTVAAVFDRGFKVALIPHTLTVTTLGLRNEGDTVNLETDVIAKYVERLLEAKE